MTSFSTEVSLADFDAAVRRMPSTKRKPANVKASIPVDTILTPDDGGILVETPIMSSLVETRNPWPKAVSVNAWKLVALCDTHKKLRSGARPSGQLMIGYDADQFFMMCGNTKLSLPLIQGKRS